MAVTVKIAFAWGLIPSAFLRSYTFGSLRRIFYVHLMDLNINYEGNAS